MASVVTDTNTMDLTVEELQYLLWEYERKLHEMGYVEQRFQDDRHLQSMADALSHCRWIAHQAQFETSRDLLLNTLGWVMCLLWSWGVETREMLIKESSGYLYNMKQRATNKMTGHGDQAGQIAMESTSRGLRNFKP